MLPSDTKKRIYSSITQKYWVLHSFILRRFGWNVLHSIKTVRNSHVQWINNRFSETKHLDSFLDLDSLRQNITKTFENLNLVLQHLDVLKKPFFCKNPLCSIFRFWELHLFFYALRTFLRGFFTIFCVDFWCAAFLTRTFELTWFFIRGFYN